MCHRVEFSNLSSTSGDTLCLRLRNAGLYQRMFVVLLDLRVKMNANVEEPHHQFKLQTFIVFITIYIMNPESVRIVSMF